MTTTLPARPARTAPTRGATTFATLAFLGALIPVVGTVVAYAIIVGGTLTVGPVTALVVGIVLLVYAQLEAYVLTPRVMSKAVAVPGALVIVAAFGGAALGGVLGSLIFKKPLPPVTNDGPGQISGQI